VPGRNGTPQPLDLSGPFAAGASDSTVKNGYISFYNGVTDQLDASPFGAFSFFLNYGYVPDGGPQFAAVPLPEHFVNRNSVRLVLETIGDCDVAGQNVLDVGCGRGGTVFVLKEFFNPALVQGIDLSPHAIEFCRRTHRYPGVRFEQGDAEQLPLPAASVQVVTNIESSHTYPHVDRFYDDVARVLAPGGHFLYTDVFEAGGLQPAIASLIDRGLTLERDRDITWNVLRSCDEIAENRTAAFGAHNDAELMQNFLAAPGSAVYDNLRRQQWVYRILKFRKNGGGGGRRAKAPVARPQPPTPSTPSRVPVRPAGAGAATVVDLRAIDAGHPLLQRKLHPVRRPAARSPRADTCARGNSSPARDPPHYLSSSARRPGAGHRGTLRA
jgi:SAM-dependent methyltransferase